MIRKTIKISVAFLLGYNTVTGQNTPAISEKDINQFFGDPNMNGAPDTLVKLVQDGNLCVANIVEKYDIEDEVKALLDTAFSQKWIETVELSNGDVFKSELANAINALTTKIIGISGKDFVDNMSYELSEWIKDTTLLWIKNKGAGQTTTEAEVKKIEEMNQHQQIVDELKSMYQKKMTS